MTEMINELIGAVSGFLYDPWVPLFLVVAGVVLTIWTGFPQIRMLAESFRVVMEKPKSADGMSSFGALMISVCAQRVMADICHDGGMIDLVYGIELEQTAAGTIDYHLDIRPKD